MNQAYGNTRLARRLLWAAGIINVLMFFTMCCQSFAYSSGGLKRFSLVCVAEGAMPKDGKMVLKGHDRKRHDPRQLGGIGEVVAKKIEENTGRETRVTVLGHLQRGGSPTPFDRILSTKFGAFAIALAAKRKFGRMVALKGNDIKNVKIEDAISRQKLVKEDTQAVIAAKAVGISFCE